MKVYVEDILAAPITASEVSKSRTVREGLLSRRVIISSRWLTRLSLIFSDVVALCTVINILLITGMVSDLSLPDVRPLIFSFILFPMAYLSFGLYRTVVLRPELELSSFTKANLAVIAGLSVPVFFIPQFELNMVMWLCLATPLVMLVVPFQRILTRLMFSRASWWGKVALVLSDSKEGGKVVEQLRRQPDMGIKPALLLQDDDTSDILSRIMNDRLLLEKITRRHSISSIVLALEPDQEYDFLQEHKENPTFRSVFLARRDDTGHMVFRFLRSEKAPVAHSESDQLMDQLRFLVKRLTDIVGAAFGLLLCAPLFVAISLAIKLTSKGPIFFKQHRMGKDGSTICVLKFRTMHLDAENKLKELLAKDPEMRREYEVYHKLTNDPRITSIGRILRRYSLDELPQLWNVLRGDMSLVGPRAYIPRERPQMCGYDQKVLESIPGITGLWQVSGRNQLSFGERVIIDVHYGKQWSLALDYYILLKTIPVVLTGNGAS